MVIGRIVRSVEELMDGLCMAPQIPIVITMGGGTCHPNNWMSTRREENLWVLSKVANVKNMSLQYVNFIKLDMEMWMGRRAICFQVEHQCFT